MIRWGLVFLACPVAFTDDQRDDLVRLAARAWFDDKASVAFDWPTMRGEVKATSEAMALGSFYGQRFQAEVYRRDGTSAEFVEFLVTEAALRSGGGTVAEA